MFLQRLLTLTFCLSFLFQSLAAQNPFNEALKQKKEEIQQQEARLQALYSELEELRLAWIHHELRALGLPVLADSGHTVSHAALVLNYSEKHEQACWVAHIIVPEVAEGTQPRTNNFRPDPKIPTGSATHADYQRSGFDRGHLAPSADFRWCFRALDESYYYSNIAPQRKELNRGCWKALEEFLRNYVISTGRPLYVVTGGILKGRLTAIGPNQISVPEYFYKVAVDFTHPEKPAIGFIMPNAGCSGSFYQYRMPVDSVEARTGIDFFTKLPDEEEKKAESRLLEHIWQISLSQNHKESKTAGKIEP